MRRAVALLALCGTAVLAAEAVHLKPMGSAYVDAKGSGLRLPQGVAVAGDLVAVADAGNGRIVTYTLTGEGLSARGEMVVQQVPFPIGVAVLPSLEILVLDGRSRRIARLSAEGAFTAWLEPSGVEGTVSVRALAAAGSTVYALDVGSGRILAMEPDGSVRGTIGIPAEVGFPSDLAVDGRGDVYVVDSVGRRLWAARKGEAALSPLTNPLPEEFEFPASIAADDEGRLFVGDRDGGGIVVFGRDGSFRGRQLAMGWKEGFLRYPADLCAAPGGMLLVAERGNNRVQVFGTR
ncbi:MAG TPA: NHL repeat-containing protein [Candidatus Polarisedimenticolaceae bacterium]|nr:NHL repeat-containing protein [Candidatus Polarisedimenticolaceae bacterium]